LINDVLDMSKIEAGKLELHPERFDLRSAIEECIELMRERAQAAKLELMVDAPDRALLVSPIAGHQSDIAESSFQRGEVHLAAAGSRKAGAREDRIWFAVEDNGMGIPERDLPRLGKPFVQVHNQPAPRTQGTGLGLALVIALAEQHQGHDAY
jgi:signal transduction histidine kinase